MKDMMEEIGPYGNPKKTTAWTDKDEPPPAPPQPPPWATAFRPGVRFALEGWQAIIRHVGCEEGRWMVLVEPVGPDRPKFRSEFRRLKAQVGKKKAEAIVKEKIAALADTGDE